MKYLEMNDTPKHILDKQREIIHSKTPQERVQMGIEMTEAVYKMVKEAIVKEKPHLNKREVAAEIFLRYYPDEFTEEEKKKITDSIKSG